MQRRGGDTGALWCPWCTIQMGIVLCGAPRRVTPVGLPSLPCYPLTIPVVEDGGINVNVFFCQWFYVTFLCQEEIMPFKWINNHSFYYDNHLQFI